MVSTGVVLAKRKTRINSEITKKDEKSWDSDAAALGNWLVTRRRFGAEDLGKFSGGETEGFGGRWKSGKGN